MNKEFIKNYILNLILEGNDVVSKNLRGTEFGEYINGKDYEAWITKSGLFLNEHFKDYQVTKKFDEAGTRAVGFGREYFDTMIGVLEGLIDSLEIIGLTTKDNTFSNSTPFEKIFISHATMDKDYVELIIQLLNDMGVPKDNEKIFCSSFEGYGIPLGEKIYDYLKKQFNQNILVIFVLSRNYYNSVPCLNEMGATWISSRAYHSILLPYFDFKNIAGAIDPTKICFRVNDSEKLNSLKDMIITNFNLNPVDGSIWERDRNKFLDQIEKLERRDLYSSSIAKVDVGRIKAIGSDKIEVDIRLINDGEVPIEFQEIIIELADENGNTLSLQIDPELLTSKIIFGQENRREVFNFDFDTSTGYNPRRNRIWNVKTSVIQAY
jgi:hypothetical protein